MGRLSPSATARKTNGVGREIVLRGCFGPDARRQSEYSRFTG